jgi:large subunit ribosomal protein L9
MKVILNHDVAKVGRKYEEKNVADGFALNYLIPKQLAEIATPQVIARVKALKAVMEGEHKVKEALLAQNIKSIEGINLQIAAKANPKGSLFAGIHQEKISEELKAQAHLDVLPAFIVLEKPIKEVGKYVVEVKAHDKTAKLKIEVSAL